MEVVQIKIKTLEIIWENYDTLFKRWGEERQLEIDWTLKNI